jgi:hypothetical protein
MDRIATSGIALSFNPDGGIIDALTIDTADGPLQPLHRAPWLRTGEQLPSSVAPVEARLAGDFFCAPFGIPTPDAPIHGWAANGHWVADGGSETADGALTARYRLEQKISGAQLAKEITLVAGQPIVYQRHMFTGDAGLIPIAHHAMIHVPGGAQLSFSPKAFGKTMNGAPETDPARGRSIFAYPQTFSSLKTVKLANGRTADASRYPFDDGHEDLSVLAEAPGTKLGWSAAVAVNDGFVFFAVKDATRLPETILWMSNGGRTYSPWNSRHRAVIGIEEAATSAHAIHELAGSPSPSPAGLVTGLDLGGEVSIRYAFGAIVVPTGWSEVARIEAAETTLTLHDVGGGSIALPFMGSHFEGLI